MPEAQGVAITGMGLVLPPGSGLAATEDVFAGRSAVRYLPDFGEVPGATGASCLDFTPPAGTEDLDRAIQFAVAAADEAWHHAGLAAPPGAHPRESRGGSADAPRGRQRERVARWVRRPAAPRRQRTLLAPLNAAAGPAPSYRQASRTLAKAFMAFSRSWDSWAAEI